MEQSITREFGDLRNTGTYSDAIFKVHLCLWEHVPLRRDLMRESERTQWLAMVAPAPSTRSFLTKEEMGDTQDQPLLMPSYSFRILSVAQPYLQTFCGVCMRSETIPAVHRNLRQYAVRPRLSSPYSFVDTGQLGLRCDLGLLEQVADGQQSFARRDRRDDGQYKEYKDDIRVGSPTAGELADGET